MPAIVTAFIPPTNHKGPRLSVRSYSRRVVVPWDHGRGTDENHRDAALSLARDLSWLDYGESDRMHTTNLPGGKGAMVHVVV